MKKFELVSNVVNKTGFKKKDVEKIIETVFECITDAMVAGDKVQLVGFGTFQVKERAERVGSNPHTGEKMIIKASKTPVFKAGKNLKDSIKAI